MPFVSELLNLPAMSNDAISGVPFVRRITYLIQLSGSDGDNTIP